MRRVITGRGPDGRSTVIADGSPPVAHHGSETSPPARLDGPWERGPVPAHEAVVHELWALSAEPAAGVADPTIAVAEADFNVPPAATKWILTEMGPGLQVPMHATPTIDYAVVVAGDVVLGLEDGEVHLDAGDTLLVDGVRHTWHAGPGGCVIATVQVGTSTVEGTSPPF